MIVLGMAMAGAMTVPKARKVKTRKEETAQRQADYNTRMRLKYYYTEAIRQQEKGNFTAAYDLLMHCLRIDSMAPAVWSSIAMYDGAVNSDSMAFADTRRATQLAPLNATFRERLAMDYLRQKEYGDAITEYENLYKNNNDRADVLDILLQLYEQEADYDNMIATLNRKEMLEGGSEQITLSKMHVYSMKGDKRAELNELENLSKKHPNDMNYRVMMGNWLLRNGEADKALALYDEVMQKEPDNVAARLSMLDYYKDTRQDSAYQALRDDILMSPATDVQLKYTLMSRLVGDQEKNGGKDTLAMVALFKKMLQQPQKKADITMLYAAYQIYKKMPQDSIVLTLRQALKIEPDLVDAQAELAQIYFERQQWQPLADLCHTSIVYNPEALPFYYFEGVALVQQDRDLEALDVFRKGVAIGDRKKYAELLSDCYGMIADILHTQQRDQEAFAAFDSCVTLNPDNYGWVNNYAYYLSLKGQDLVKAEQMSYRTVKAEPTNATYLDTYAWILFQQGRYSEAKIYIDETLANDTAPSAVSLEHAGDIYAMNGEVDKAVSFWQKAQQLEPDNRLLAAKIRKRKYLKYEK